MEMCNLRVKVFFKFSNQAMKGVLVGGNKDVVSHLLMVFIIPPYNPITHVWIYQQACSLCLYTLNQSIINFHNSNQNITYSNNNY
jgi:hypothetical protein